jgi:proline iminopeptidase
VRAFCDSLGIVAPIVLGASFGGMVAMAYATRHPAHPSKLILISTAASGAEYLNRRIELFERFGGPEVGALARRHFVEVKGHTGQASLDAWRRLAMPHYFRSPRDPDMARRAVSRSDVLLWFSRPDGESHSFNLFPDLHRIQCPTLVLGGEDDPMHPIESQADIAAALPTHLVQFERFANCGHAVMPECAGAHGRSAARVHRAPLAGPQNETGAPRDAGHELTPSDELYELAFSTVTARRFCDQQEMSLQTATGRSLP